MGPSAGSGRGRSRGAPSVVVEGLRLLVVAFFAGAGYEVGSGIGSQHVLGWLNGTAVGLVLGSGAGLRLGRGAEPHHRQFRGLRTYGKETGQAVGYLDDGSMVVVEHARDQVGS